MILLDDVIEKGKAREKSFRLCNIDFAGTLANIFTRSHCCRFLFGGCFWQMNFSIYYVYNILRIYNVESLPLHRVICEREIQFVILHYIFAKILITIKNQICKNFQYFYDVQI